MVNYESHNRYKDYEEVEKEGTDVAETGVIAYSIRDQVHSLN